MKQMLLVAGLASGAWFAVAGPPGGQAAWGSLRLPADTGERIRLTLAPAGNEARYRVREQLANLDFPNDAVGTTSAVTGSLVLDADGNVVSAESRFVIDITTLKSDKERRDGYLQRRTLETAQFPTVTLVPTVLRNLPWPLPASGRFSFEMNADLTIKEVTRGVRWQVEAEAVGGGFTGTASTRFPFEAFALTRPRVSVVLSVENEIRLEFDFHLVPDTATGG